MQILRFIVKGQMIKKDPKSPFSTMVANSSNYYVAEFDMDEAWIGYSCLAHFKTRDYEKYVPIVNGRAVFPEEILKYKGFFVRVVGKNGDSYLNTNEDRVVQIGGK